MTTKYADTKLSEAIAGAQDTMINKLMKRKSRIEVASITSYTDYQDRRVTIYYLTDNLPLSHQTDLCEEGYIIEQVVYKGRKVRLTGKGEQHLLTWLNETNPQKLR